ncbi:MAG: NADH-quinone oxidoreductase subunit A [Elusimicrobiaceae bacterium]|nr:NADH-quinone oxidoreductase subunit A [Elusimicrobiaceae bacterium]
MTEIAYISALFFFSACAGIIVRAAGKFAGNGGFSRAESRPYESGSPSKGTARVNMLAEFYPAALVCMALTAALAPVALWSAQAQKTAPEGFLAAAMFLGVICMSGLLAYYSGLFKSWQNRQR